MIAWCGLTALYILGAMNMALLIKEIGNLYHWRSFVVIALWPPVALAAAIEAAFFRSKWDLR